MPKVNNLVIDPSHIEYTSPGLVLTTNGMGGAEWQDSTVSASDVITTNGVTVQDSLDNLEVLNPSIYSDEGRKYIEFLIQEALDRQKKSIKHFYEKDAH